jgi:hypothetical protein
MPTNTNWTQSSCMAVHHGFFRMYERAFLCEFVLRILTWTCPQAPGGRDNARMVSRATFECLSLPHVDGSYYLRPNAVLGGFSIDSEVPFDSKSLWDSKLRTALQAGLAAECSRDEMSAEEIRRVDRIMLGNVERIHDALLSLSGLPTRRMTMAPTSVPPQDSAPARTSNMGESIIGAFMSQMRRASASDGAHQNHVKISGRPTLRSNTDRGSILFSLNPLLTSSGDHLPRASGGLELAVMEDGLELGVDHAQH